MRVRSLLLMMAAGPGAISVRGVVLGDLVTSSLAVSAITGRGLVIPAVVTAALVPVIVSNVVRGCANYVLRVRRVWVVRMVHARPVVAPICHVWTRTTQASGVDRCKWLLVEGTGGVSAEATVVDGLHVEVACSIRISMGAMTGAASIVVPGTGGDSTSATRI